MKKNSKKQCIESDELLVEQISRWLMINTSLEVEKIVDLCKFIRKSQSEVK